MTLEDLHKFNGDVRSTIEWAEKQKGVYPNKPFAPKLKSYTPTSDEASNYIDMLKKYNNDMGLYNSINKEFIEKATNINNVIEAYIKYKAGLHKIPEKYQNNVFTKAYTEGYDKFDEGYYDVYKELIALIECYL